MPATGAHEIATSGGERGPRAVLVPPESGPLEVPLKGSGTALCRRGGRRHQGPGEFRRGATRQARDNG
jgi:hypothetical protein